LGARGASEALLALAEDRGEWSASDEARLRSGSGDEDEEDDGETEPGRRSVRVRAVSSKSNPEAAEDSVELRSVSADMVGDAGWGRGASAAVRWLQVPRRGRKGKRFWLQWGRQWSGSAMLVLHISPSLPGHSGHHFQAVSWRLVMGYGIIERASLWILK
jgi:hypothetical protein